MVDVNALYPIVHDLTEAEYSTERPIGPEELYSFATKSSLSFQDMLYQPNKKSHYVSNPSLRQFRETRSETKEDFRSKDDTSEKLADESRGILKKGFEECYLLTRQVHLIGFIRLSSVSFQTTAMHAHFVLLPFPD